MQKLYIFIGKIEQLQHLLKNINLINKEKRRLNQNTKIYHSTCEYIYNLKISQS